MAPQCGIVLPRLDHIPVEHRFISDDREIIRLAEILTDSNIAAADDWNESKRDPTKYVTLALQRWLRDHGAVAADRRFDLEVVLSDRLVDYSERGEEGTLHLIVDPDGAAFVLLNPVIELLGRVHPKLPATFFSIFVGSLNRWVRVYDDAEERVEMLREWYEGGENPEQYEVPDVDGCTPKCLKQAPLSLRGLKVLGQSITDKQIKPLITGPAGAASSFKPGQTTGVHRRYGRAAHGQQSAAAMPPCGILIRRCRGLAASTMKPRLRWR
jgi:hypothetical protein